MFFRALAGVFFVLASMADAQADVTPAPKEGTWELIGPSTCVGIYAGSFEAAKSASIQCAIDALSASRPTETPFTFDHWYDPTSKCNTAVDDKCVDASVTGMFRGTIQSTGQPSPGVTGQVVRLRWSDRCPDGSEPDPVTGECGCSEALGMPRYIYPMFEMDQGMDVAYCYQQCVYTSSGGGGVCIGLGDGPVYCKGKARLMEGAKCTGQDYESAAPENCAIMGGQMICMDAPKRDCSVIDGEAICGPAPPSGCKLLANGGMLCDDDAPKQPTNPDGTPADPDGQVISDSGDIQNYYSSETVNNSGTPTQGEWTGGDGDGDGDGLEGVAQEDTLQSVLDALTPGDGDEVGTDTGVIAEWLGETGISDVEAAVQREENIPGLSSSFLPVLPAGGTCQKVSGTALGMSFEFPSNTGCVYLGYFREILAWALYILTIVYIWSIVMRRKED